MSALSKSPLFRRKLQQAKWKAEAVFHRLDSPVKFAALQSENSSVHLLNLTPWNVTSNLTGCDSDNVSHSSLFVIFSSLPSISAFSTSGFKLFNASAALSRGRSGCACRCYVHTFLARVHAGVYMCIQQPMYAAHVYWYMFSQSHWGLCTVLWVVLEMWDSEREWHNGSCLPTFGEYQWERLFCPLAQISFWWLSNLPPSIPAPILSKSEPPLGTDHV